MITLPIWLLILIGLFSLPILAIIIAFIIEIVKISVEIVKIVILILKEIIKDIW